MSEAPVLEVSASVDPAGWDEEVASLDGGPFHSHAWAQYRANERDGKPLFIRWTSSGAPTSLGLAVGVRIPPPRGISVFGSAIEIPTVPAGSGPEDPGAALFRWAADRRNVAALELESFDADASWAAPTLRTFSRRDRIEFIAHPADRASAISRMRSGTRSAIRRAENAGFGVRSAVDLREHQRFAELHAATLARLRTQKGIRGDITNTKSFARRLHGFVRTSRAELFVAGRDGNDVAAGCVFARFGGRAYYLLNGATDEARTAGATPLILAEAISRLYAHGIERINLGGTPAAARDPESADHGLYSFKLGLGAEPVERSSLSVRLPGVRGRVRQLASFARR